MFWRTVALVLAPTAVVCLGGAGLAHRQARAQEVAAFRDRAERSMSLLAKSLARDGARADGAALQRRLDAAVAVRGTELRALRLERGENAFSAGGSEQAPRGHLQLERDVPGGRLLASFTSRWSPRADSAQGRLLFGLCGVALAAAFAFALCWRGRRSHHRLLHSLEGSAGELKVLLAELARATELQALAAAESVNALGQMQEETQTVQTVAERTSSAAGQLVASGEAAEQGVDAVIVSVGGAAAALDQLRAQMTSIDASAATLVVRAAVVDDIASRVGMLAERSHLLALNAAMEAARAGSQGRGFAVVSAQMRALADGSYRAAGEVKSIIMEIQSALGGTLSGAEESNRRIVNAQELIERAQQRMSGVALLTRELVGMGRSIAQSAEGQIAAAGSMANVIVQASQADMEQLQATQYVDEANGGLANVSESLLRSLDGKPQGHGHGAATAWLDRTTLLSLAPLLGVFAALFLSLTAYLLERPEAWAQALERQTLVRAHELAAHLGASGPDARSALSGVSGTEAAPSSPVEDEAHARSLLEALKSAPDLSGLGFYPPTEKGVWMGTSTRRPGLEGAGQLRTEDEVVAVVSAKGGALVELRSSLEAGRALEAQRRSLLWSVSWLSILVAALMSYLAAVTWGQLRLGLVGTLRRAVAEVDDAGMKLASASVQHGTASVSALQAIESAYALARTLTEEAGVVADSTDALSTQKARAEEEADGAIGIIIDARKAMGHVRDQMVSTGRAVRFFSERAGAVGEIAGAVAKLSQRSNLLALNAAIEASRAGEEGRGFAVVAEEMRALAASSNQSAADVKAVVVEIHDAVNQAVVDAQRGEEAATHAVSRADVTAEGISHFGSTLLEFSRVIEHIATAASEERETMARMMQAIRDAFDAATQQRRASERVRVASQRLVGLSRELSELINGGERAPGPAPSGSSGVEPPLHAPA